MTIETERTEKIVKYRVDYMSGLDWSHLEYTGEDARKNAYMIFEAMKGQRMVRIFKETSTFTRELIKSNENGL